MLDGSTLGEVCSREWVVKMERDLKLIRLLVLVFFRDRHPRRSSTFHCATTKYAYFNTKGRRIAHDPEQNDAFRFS